MISTTFKANAKKISRVISTLISIFFFLLLGNTANSQATNNCVEAVLDLKTNGYNWQSNATQADFTVEDQHFDINISDPDNVLETVNEAGSGIMVSMNPNNVHDEVTITYNLSKVTDNVRFVIKDLDYKNYGHYGSNQQEAVCIFGYWDGVLVMPKIVSLNGSVHISGNCAEATTDSKKGKDESIKVSFDTCVDKIEIVYGTGSNSPVHNPTYGKIYIGETGGFLASTCNVVCDKICVDATLNFNQNNLNWDTGNLNDSFTIADQTFNINIEDENNILEDIETYKAGLLVGIDPHTKNDVVEISYQLSEKSDDVQFTICDLDYKKYGYHSSNQQEAVCIYGFNDDIEISPNIQAYNGSVEVDGNCAEAKNDSKNGHNECIKISFSDCVNKVVIEYGSGSLTPVSNPTYSKIYIATDDGFLAAYCENTCLDCELAVDAGMDQSICSNESIELVTQVSGISKCINCDKNNLLAHWNMDHCDASGADGHEDCNSNAPIIKSTSNLNIHATAPCKAFRDFSCRKGYKGQTVCFKTKNGGYAEGDNKAVIFDLTINPKQGYEAIFSGIEFYVSSADNYHIKYGIRVIAGNTELYKKTNMSLNGNWKKQQFDFTDLDGFVNTASTTFTFEILGYNGGKAIEIDEFKAYGGTCEIFDPADEGLTYLWSNGETTPNIEVQTSGTYEVTVTDCNGCEATDEVSINITPDPTAYAGEDVSICLGESAELNATGGLTYIWDNGATDSTINVTPTVTTTYKVTVSNGNGCEATDEVLVTVNPLPIAAVTNDEICLGEAATISASGGQTYLWEDGSQDASITINPAATSTYSVTVTDENGCADSAEGIVTVNPNPIAEVTNEEICLGNQATISASGGQTYLWEDGSQDASITINPAATSTYSVTVTDENGCIDSAEGTVTVNPNPIAVVNNPAICIGDNVDLIVSGGETYLWENGSSSNTINVSPDLTSTYMVTVEDSNGCKAEAEAQVIVNDLPVVDAGDDVEICEGESTTLTATGGTSYVWNNGSMDASISVNPLFRTEYMVTVADGNGCSATDNVIVDVINIVLGEISTKALHCRVPTAGESVTIEIVIESEFQPGFEQYFILASAPDKKAVKYIQRIGLDPKPKFNVSILQNGLYTIHSFVANPTMFDIDNYLQSIIDSEMTITDIFNFTIEGGGELCAKVDQEGIETELSLCLFANPKIEVDSNEKFQLYPIPANQFLFIESFIENEIISLSLIGVDGKILENFRLHEISENKFMVNIKKYKPGIYFIKILTANDSKILKAIFE